jgi:hypothetical protein
MTTSAEARRRPDSNGLRISRKSHDWEAPLTGQLAHDRSGCREGNRSEKTDVIAELQDKRVVVTNADIDADAVEILSIGWVTSGYSSAGMKWRGRQTSTAYPAFIDWDWSKIALREANGAHSSSEIRGHSPSGLATALELSSD